MEMNGVIIIEETNGENIKDIKSQISGLAKDCSGHFEFESEKKAKGQILLEFMAGSDGSDILERLFEALADNKVKFARASITGDEDPFVFLYSLMDGNYSKVDIDPNRYEYLLDIEDEELLEKGPRNHILDDFTKWKNGITVIKKFTDIKDVIEGVIEECEEMAE